MSKGIPSLCLAVSARCSAFSQPFSGSYEFVNASSGMVLGVRSQSTNNGAVVIQWIGNGGGNQQWMIRWVLQTKPIRWRMDSKPIGALFRERALRTRQ